MAGVYWELAQPQDEEQTKSRGEADESKLSNSEASIMEQKTGVRWTENPR